MMNLIDEEDRLLARSAQPVGRRRHDFPHLGDIALDSAQADKFRLRHRRDDLREGGFARAGRAGKNDRRQSIRLDRAAQEFAGREDVLLPDKLLERARSHPAGERRGGIGLCVRLRLGEQVFHVEE